MPPLGKLPSLSKAFKTGRIINSKDSDPYLVVGYNYEINNNDCTIIIKKYYYDLFTKIIERRLPPFIIQNPLCKPRDRTPDPTEDQRRKDFPPSKGIQTYYKQAQYYTSFGDQGSQHQIIKEIKNFKAVYQEYPGNIYDGGNYALGDYILYGGRKASASFRTQINGFFKEGEGRIHPKIYKDYELYFDGEYITINMPHGRIYYENENGRIFYNIYADFPIDQYGNFVLPEWDYLPVVISPQSFGIVDIVPPENIQGEFVIQYPATQTGVKVTCDYNITAQKKDYQYSEIDHDNGRWVGKYSGLKAYTKQITWNIKANRFSDTVEVVRRNLSQAYMGTAIWNYWSRFGGGYIPYQSLGEGENWYYLNFAEKGIFNIGLFIPGDTFNEGDFATSQPPQGLTIYGGTPLESSLLFNNTDNSGHFVGYLAFSTNPEHEFPGFNEYEFRRIRTTEYREGYNKLLDPFQRYPESWNEENLPATESQYFAIYNEPPPMKDNCCQDIKNLLKVIIKQQGNFPQTVYNSLLTEEGVQPQKNKSINSIAEYFEWSYERLDELMGEWESTVKLKTKNDKGEDVEEIIRLSNLAEAISELYSLSIQSYTRTDTILNIVTRVLLESGTIKQQDFKTYKAIMSIVDWMNFSIKETSEEMPLTFDPSKAKNFEDLLKETDIQVSVINAADNKHTLNETLHNLMFAAAIIKGTFYRKTGNELKTIFPTVQAELDKLSGTINIDEVEKWTNELLKKNDS